MRSHKNYLVQAYANQSYDQSDRTKSPQTRTRSPPPRYTPQVHDRDNGCVQISRGSRVAFNASRANDDDNAQRMAFSDCHRQAVIAVDDRPADKVATGGGSPALEQTPMESIRSSTRSLVSTRTGLCGVGCRMAGFTKGLTLFFTSLPELSLNKLGERYYATFLLRRYVRIAVLVTFVGFFAAAVYCCTLVRDGLDLGDVLPHGTREHDAIVVQNKYFSFYNMYIVTKDFDYASEQQNLLSLHDQIGRIDYVIRQTDGSLMKFWLQYFREWLRDLQRSFDTDGREGRVNSSTWTPEADDNTVLAFKLLIQTGKFEQPTDYSRIGCRDSGPCDRIDRVRLVEDNGLIREDAFYNFLTAWVASDPLAYAASQAAIQPAPITWDNSRKNLNLYIPRSPAIIYSQMPFFLNGLRKNEDFVSVITTVRRVCDSFASTSAVESYPSGYPFLFWQQYIDLRYWLFISVACVIGAVFLVLTCVLVNPWTATLVALFLLVIVTELLGYMGAMQVKLSAVPAVILIASVGIGVEFTVHIVLAFITSCGSRHERVSRSIGHMLGPVIDGAISTLLGVIMLAGAEFDFIIKYFFQVLAVLIFLGVMNGLILLPVVLSFFGPPMEVAPIGDVDDRMATPTPPSSPPACLARRTCRSSCANKNANNCNLAWNHHHRSGENCCSARDDRFYRVVPSPHAACGCTTSSSPPLSATSHRPMTSRCNYSSDDDDMEVVWRHHPHSVPSSTLTGGARRIREQVFIYPECRVVYQNAPKCDGTRQHQNEANDGGCSISTDGIGHTNRADWSNSASPGKVVTTITATSSVRVKVHSSQQEVIDLELPDRNSQPGSSSATNQKLTAPQRRFDISALSSYSS